MNVGSIQALVGNLQQSASQAENAEGSNQFGSVFNSALASGTGEVASTDENLPIATTEKTIEAILNATTMEEIVEILGVNSAPQEPIIMGQLGLGEVAKLTEDNSDLLAFFKLPELEQLAGLLDTDLEQFIESVVQLLEKAGLSESELQEALYANNFWSLLDNIEKVAPKFFAEIADALEGKGAIPKEQAVELLALLKSVAIVAPKTDLMMKQEQQVFSLQGFLLVTGEKFETAVSSNQNRNNMMQNRNNMMQLINTQQIVIPVSAGQSAQQEESLKDNPKEVVQPMMTQVATDISKSEVSLTELENRNNSRNEALLREMQGIFKRSNFGQTGGTNRLLIKLYPEHLGQVRIELLQVNGVMTARILASSALGKEMLESQLHQLRGAFVQQNLQVERIDISQTLQDTTRNDRDQAFNQHFRREQEEPTEQQDENPDEEMTFQEYMIELEA